jgi:SEC-C motif-containing protein
MRSRYAAYAKGLVDYIIDTTDPEGPRWREEREAWRSEIEVFCVHTRFDGLAILDAPPPAGDHGTVTFRATLSRNGQDVSFAEKSTFRRFDRRWYYVDGSPQ